MAIANTTIQLKKSGISGNIPVYLSSGELALNYFDGKLYYKNAQNTISFFSAGSTKSFATINANSSLILSSSNNDIISFATGNNVSITTDVVNKVITFSTDAKMLYTASNTAPITPRYGDKWYYIARDIVYEWSTDGTSSFWLDNLSPTVTSNPGGGGGGTTDLTPVYASITTSFTKANSANILAQAAFTKANTASDSITIIQGVNVTQKTNITAVNNFVISSFNKANSSNILAQAAFDAANTAGSSAFSQAAFNVANTATDNITIIQGVDLTQNTNITAVNNLAQAAFNTANTANTSGSAAFSQAAFNQANSANILANAAYTLANTTPIIGLNSTSITSNVVIGTNYNGFSVGPLLINNGRSVTIKSGQRWVII
jgi:hypothetical protein